jgi:hypothetical protein
MLSNPWNLIRIMPAKGSGMVKHFDNIFFDQKPFVPSLEQRLFLFGLPHKIHTTNALKGLVECVKQHGVHFMTFHLG